MARLARRCGASGRRDLVSPVDQQRYVEDLWGRILDLEATQAVLVDLLADQTHTAIIAQHVGRRFLYELTQERRRYVAAQTQIAELLEVPT